LANEIFESLWIQIFEMKLSIRACDIWHDFLPLRAELVSENARQRAFLRR